MTVVTLFSKKSNQTSQTFLVFCLVGETSRPNAPKLRDYGLANRLTLIKTVAAKPNFKIRKGSNSRAFCCWADIVPPTCDATSKVLPPPKQNEDAPALGPAGLFFGLCDPLAVFQAMFCLRCAATQNRVTLLAVANGPKPLRWKPIHPVLQVSPPNGWAKAQQARPNASLTESLLFGPRLRSTFAA